MNCCRYITNIISLSWNLELISNKVQNCNC